MARGVRAASFGDGDGVGRRRELVVREEAGAVETVVRLERDAVERAHRLRFQVLHLKMAIAMTLQSNPVLSSTPGPDRSGGYKRLDDQSGGAQFVLEMPTVLCKTTQIR